MRNSEDVAGAGELVLDATDTETRGRRTMDNKQQGDAATPTAPPTSNAYQVPAAPKSCHAA